MKSGPRLPQLEKANTAKNKYKNKFKNGTNEIIYKTEIDSQT